MKILKKLSLNLSMLGIAIRRVYIRSPLWNAVKYAEALWNTFTWVLWIASRAVWHLLSKDLREAAICIEHDTRDAFNSTLKSRMDELQAYVDNARNLIAGLRRATSEVREAVNADHVVALCNEHIRDCEAEIRSLHARVK